MGVIWNKAYCCGLTASSSILTMLCNISVFRYFPSDDIDISYIGIPIYHELLYVYHKNGHEKVNIYTTCALDSCNNKDILHIGVLLCLHAFIISVLWHLCVRVCSIYSY